MPRYYAVALKDLKLARVAYERDEPRDLFYRVALALMADAEAGRGQFSMVEGLAVLLQSWNLGYYQRGRHPFDQAHYDAIEGLLKSHKRALARLRERPIEGMTDADRPTVERIFDAFFEVLGAVGSAKTLHLLAPRWFPIFDNYILGAFHIYGRDGRAYWRFMTGIRAQARMLGGEVKAGQNVVKALDELSFCRFTLKLPDFDPPRWIELGPDHGATSPGPAPAGAGIGSRSSPRHQRPGRAEKVTGPPLPPLRKLNLTNAPHGAKSEAMRGFFALGYEVADVARAVGVDYPFAYGVRQRWLAKGGKVAR